MLSKAASWPLILLTRVGSSLGKVPRTRPDEGFFRLTSLTSYLIRAYVGQLQLEDPRHENLCSLCQSEETMILLDGSRSCDVFCNMILGGPVSELIPLHLPNLRLQAPANLTFCTIFAYIFTSTRVPNNYNGQILCAQTCKPMLQKETHCIDSGT